MYAIYAEFDIDFIEMLGATRFKKEADELTLLLYVRYKEEFDRGGRNRIRFYSRRIQKINNIEDSAIKSGITRLMNAIEEYR